MHRLDSLLCSRRKNNCVGPEAVDKRLGPIEGEALSIMNKCRFGFSSDKREKLSHFQMYSKSPQKELQERKMKPTIKHPTQPT
jgi:hypothetical protein